MKITAEHYDVLKTAIARLSREECLAHKALELGKDKNMRFRWDLLYMSKMIDWVCDNLYTYLDDTHVDTALKSIVKELALD